MLRKPVEQSEGWKDLEWSLGLNRVALRMLGVWPEERHLAKEPWSVKMRVPLLILVTLLWVGLPQMCALYLVIDELPLAIDNFVTNCGSVTACAKYLFLWRNKHVLWPVIDSVRSDWLRAKPGWERGLMIEHAARARLFTVGGYWLLAGCYAGYTFLPLLGFNIRIVNNITDHGQRHLLFQTYYPFDYWRSPYFELTELLQLFVGFFIGLSVSMPDNYFGALVFHASAQLEILDRRMERCIANGASSSSPGHVDLARVTSAIVRRHVQLVKLVWPREIVRLLSSRDGRPDVLPALQDSRCH